MAVRSLTANGQVRTGAAVHGCVGGPANETMSIEAWVPIYDVGQRHAVELPVAPEIALRRALDTPAAADGFTRALFRLRGLRPDGTIREFAAANGFTLLEESPTTFVVGLIAQRGRLVPSDASEWRSSNQRGSLKIALDFRAEPSASGTRLVTETRVAAATASARRVFRLYWLIVGPFSKLIRRRWLAAIAARVRLGDQG